MGGQHSAGRPPSVEGAYDGYDMMYLVCVMCGMESMLCTGFSLCYVWDLVCLMCGILSVLCEVFSLCYVQSLVCVMCSL